MESDKSEERQTSSQSLLQSSEPEHVEVSSTAIARNDVLATAYDTFQSQVEIAGQIFTTDLDILNYILTMFSEFNIIVCGSPRVGKSTLINAICSQTLAETSPGLDSCTQDITCYALTDTCYINNQWINYTYNFWDTPGFENWNENDIRKNVAQIVEKPGSDPLCMIFCAAPGSFAKTEQLKWLLDICIQERKIFCALVVTNKWAGLQDKRMAILNKYKELLSHYHPQTCEEKQGITYFGNVGLCTMVNAQPYVDEEQGINKPQQGIDELLEGIMTCLNSEGKVFHWCMATMQKKGLVDSLMEKMKHIFPNLQDFLTDLFTNKKSVR
ncbi:unnamed protein product [Rotaria sp. Silwood2]|nr:unnamed protein product [Rotaria sp. Silwood2]CAF2915835.1 unnamed protein product [Rotaria sp. Silwood2]CAF3317056.1 unnamed protein product [Rotaria sp. Silwood2]CAF3321898.1 unnamed protein product [Rotaria sp. Silwood2]CAF3936018.1 unnamed protein product [Rotaria sp. Silwood2]